jgi:two-component system chemotaxis response regulator CheB
MSIAEVEAPIGFAADHARIRVMVVDDAVVVRAFIGRWVEEQPDMQLVASVPRASTAIEQIERQKPDVVLLDVNMPEMDGITALPLLLAKNRNLVVLMVSTLTRRNAEISLQALSLGAADYLPKPESDREFMDCEAFRRELIDKIRVLGSRRTQAANAAHRSASGEPKHFRHGWLPVGAAELDAPASSRARGMVLRPFARGRPRVLLIGASTGGPQALSLLLGAVGGVIDAAPVLITQHMPPTFTTVLAEHLARTSGRPAAEASDGERICPGRIYLAPGGLHMRVARCDGTPVIVLDDGPPIQFCKPAVDPLFASAATVWRSANLALVLTGMGSDGALGAAQIVAAGGSVIAQDEGSSVVWGMPGRVAQAGLASAVLPLHQIAAKVVRLFSGDRL